MPSGGGGQRPSVLWITDEPPDRSLGGGNIRQAHLVEGLARAADVTLLLVGELHDDVVRAAVREVVEVAPVRLPEPRTRFVRRLFDLWLALGAGPAGGGHHGPPPSAPASAGRRSRAAASTWWWRAIRGWPPSARDDPRRAGCRSSTT